MDPVVEGADHRREQQQAGEEDHGAEERQLGGGEWRRELHQPLVHELEADAELLRLGGAVEVDGREPALQEERLLDGAPRLRLLTARRVPRPTGGRPPAVRASAESRSSPWWSALVRARARSSSDTRSLRASASLLRLLAT